MSAGPTDRPSAGRGADGHRPSDRLSPAVHIMSPVRRCTQHDKAPRAGDATPTAAVVQPAGLAVVEPTATSRHRRRRRRRRRRPQMRMFCAAAAAAAAATANDRTRRCLLDRSRATSSRSLCDDDCRYPNVIIRSYGRK